ncbi:hypothetical protein Acsp03_49880 [Actinomadura sp. NBRC 104412]|uniref:hypothetical protein n=1 Tax=Actinomadura sp. NBRC 104412 TaxID=3032203 RepID=UPI00249FBFC4|nr:hypothetical protein [Actinomadura sp. NBRC 104412]GLZ07522.1 hypothetical protein Acsp03_49880 [Actinomadura sp. NBRC 104412]
MNGRLILRTLAFYYPLLGAVWLIAPQSGLGEDPDAHAEFVGRVLGGYLVTIAALNWLAGSSPAPFVRRVLWINVGMNAVPAAISTVNIANGSFGSSSWTGVVAHTIPIAWILAYLLISARTPEKRES